MIQLSACIEGQSRLRGWTKSVLCLCKVGDIINFEITRSKVSITNSRLQDVLTQIVISTFNSSRAVFSLAQFPSDSFFQSYSYQNTSVNTIFQLKAKVLTSLFRKMERDGAAIDKCILSFKDKLSSGSSAPDKLRVDIYMQSGITKSFRVSCLEVAQVPHPQMEKKEDANKFAAGVVVFKQYLEHMSPRAEEFQLSLDDSIVLSGFTSGVVADREILKHPLRTTVTLDREEFESINAAKGSGFSIRMKEFRAFVALADSLNVHSIIKGTFTSPGYPVIFEVTGPVAQHDNIGIIFIFIAEGVDLSDSADQTVSLTDSFMTSTSSSKRSNVGEINAAMPSFKRPAYSGISVDASSLTARAEESLVSEMPENELNFATVEWDSTETVQESGQQIQDPPQPRASDDLFDDEDDDELALFAENLEKGQVGPTQNQTRAKGLFD